jgi:hypothetical protein
MERDIVERLAMDSASGELSEDMEAIFKEYLAEHPDENKWAEDMMRICQATQMTVDAKTNRAAIADVDIKPRLMVRLLPIARWAAVVIFAAFIGIAAGRWSKSPVISERPAHITAFSDLTVERPGLDLEGVGESFWQRKALAMLTSPSSQIHGDYVTGPKLWERYRQFIKEKNYE